MHEARWSILIYISAGINPVNYASARAKLNTGYNAFSSSSSSLSRGQGANICYVRESARAAFRFLFVFRVSSYIVRDIGFDYRLFS